MYLQAKSKAPCIIFIDEIDAVGRQRGAGMGGGNDEREQTINQLLSEMDGFEGNTGVIVVAATNRPDVSPPTYMSPATNLADQHAVISASQTFARPCAHLYISCQRLQLCWRLCRPL